MMINIRPLILLSLLGGVVLADETIGDAFTNGKVKGLLRYNTQHRDTSYYVLQDAPEDIAHNKIQSYSAIGGYIGYETAPILNLSAGATLYSSNPIGNNHADRRGLGGLDESKGGQDAYLVVGEAFLKYQDEKHLAKMGRQEIPNFKFVSLTNVRMTPLTHEGAIYENSSIDGLHLNFAYLTGQKDRNSEEFKGMVKAARVKTGCGVVDSSGRCVDSGSNINIRGDYNPNDYDSSGNYAGESKDMPLIGATYKYDSGKVDIWDYLVLDFVNIIYLYSEYYLYPLDGWKVTLAGQYGNQQSVGDSVAGDIDTWFYGLKATANIDNGIKMFLSFNEVSYNEESYDGGTLFVRWGSPQMFNSFQVQDSELGGTKSIGAGVEFDLGTLGILDSTAIRFRHSKHNLPDDLYMRDARQDRSESTFDMRYSFSKDSGFGIFTQMDGLSIQLRVAYNNFKTDYDIEAYKKIHGYNAFSVTDDFIDARIYIDYIF
jgi:hypothetical protein